MYGTWYQVPGSWFRVPGTRYLLFGIPGAGNQLKGGAGEPAQSRPNATLTSRPFIQVVEDLVTPARSTVVSPSIPAPLH